MRLRVVVVGIPGVGKTTVLQNVVAGWRGSKVVPFGTIMFEEGVRLRWIDRRDDLRKMPVEKQKRLQRLAARAISSMKDDVLFVDTHLFVRTQEGFWPGLPDYVAEALKPTHLVLIEAASEEILARRKKDTTRYRDAVARDELESELSLARSFLTSASSVSGAPALILRNREGKALETAQSLIDALRKAGP